MRGASLFLFAAAFCTAQTYSVQTIAGTGTPGSSGDGGPAFGAALNEPTAVALDAAGRLFIADRNNFSVRRIDPDGTIRSVMSTGDVAAADIAVDSAGTLYVAAGPLIRSVKPDGSVATFAGPEGLTSVSALAAEPAGTLLAGDGTRLLRISRDGGVTEIATFAGNITGIAVRADGGIYAIAGDTMHSIDGNGAAVPVAAATSVTPGARVAVDRWGDIYYSGSRIYKIAAGRSYILAEDANAPAGMAADSGGNVYYADALNHRVRVLRPPFAGAISAIAPSSRAVEVWPRNIALLWTPLPNATYYEVFFGGSPDNLSLLGTVPDSSYRLQPLPDRTDYYWRVRTQFPPLPPIESAVFSFTTTTSAAQPPPLPDAPNPPSFAIAQPGAFTLSWRGSGASRYEVFLDENVNAISRAGITSEPRLPISGLKPETLYYWRVVAVNDAGQTASARWQFTTGPANGYPWLIETIAGTALPTADGTVATEAILRLPRSPVADTAGTVHFIDGERSLRRIGPDGKLATTFTLTTAPLTTLAADTSFNLYFGTSEYVVRINRAGQRTFIAGQPVRRGFGGDGGPGTAALLDGVTSIAADRRGNVYIADSNNNRIRVLGPNGQIRTFAGDGACGETDGNGTATSLPLCVPSQVTVNASGTVFAYAGGLLLRITPGGSSERIAPDTQFGSVYGLTLDGAGNLYVLEPGLIRRIDPEGIVTPFAGGGDLFASPGGLGIDAPGNLLVGDTRNHRIRRVDSAGFTTTLAGADPSSYLYGPTDVAIDASGTVYVADSLNHRIRRLFAGRAPETFAGGGSLPVSGPEIQGRNARDLRLDLTQPGVLALDERGNLIFNTQRLPASRPGDVLLGVMQNGTAASYADPGVVRIGGIARGPGGELYVSDTTGQRILRLNADGTVNTIAGTGVAGFEGDGGSAVLGQLNSPKHLAFSRDGELYIAEFGRIRRITLDGRIVTVANANAEGLAFDASGALYASSGGSIYRTVPDTRVSGLLTLARIAGRQSGTPGTNLALDVFLNDPRGIAFTPDGDLVFADEGDNVIRRMTRHIPSTLTITGGNDQTANASNVTATPLKVRVTGRTGVPVAGVSVRFAITSGTVVPIDLGTVTTNASGEAQRTLSLGTRTGSVTVSASLPGGPSVDFRIQAAN